MHITQFLKLPTSDSFSQSGSHMATSQNTMLRAPSVSGVLLSFLLSRKCWDVLFVAKNISLNINLFWFLPIHRCVLALYTRYFPPESCEKKYHGHVTWVGFERHYEHLSECKQRMKYRHKLIVKIQSWLPNFLSEL